MTLTNTYRSTVTMPCIFLPCGSLRRAPFESWLKLVLAFIALVIEGYTGLKFSVISKASQPQHEEHNTEMHESAGSHVHARHADMDMGTSDKLVYHTWSFEKGNAQHITMYSAFILGSIVEILIHHGVNLPRKIEHALGVLAFAIEGFLFAFHLHGKEPIEVYVHVLLVYAIYGCAIFAALEMYNEKQVLFTYGRIVFTMLQGTWFYQVGFMLYPPTDNPAFKWDLSDHSLIMVITVCYCWHLLLIVIGLLIQLGLVRHLYFRASDRLKARLDELIYIDNNCTRDNDYKLFLNDDANKNGGVHTNDRTNLFALNSEDEEENTH